MKTIDLLLFQLALKIKPSERRIVMLGLSTYKKQGLSKAEKLCAALFSAGSAAEFAEKTARQNAPEKYQLFGRLTDLLARQSSEKPEQELRLELNRLTVLQERQLYEEALKRSQKLADKAQEQFCIPEEMRLREFGNLLILNHFKAQVNSVSLARERELGHIYLRILDLRELLLKMYRIEFRKGQPHAPEQQLAYQKLWTKALRVFDPASVPVHARVSLYNARGLVLNRLSRFKESVNEYKKAIRLFNASEHLRAAYFLNYIGSYNNLLSVLAKMKDEKRFYHSLAEFAALANTHEIKQNPDLLRKIRLRVIIQELDFLVLQNHPLRASELVAGRESELIEITRKSETSERHFLLLKFTTLAAEANNWKLALRWNNMLISEGPENTRQDMLYASYVFSLIIHFELENLDLIGSLVRTFKRRFSRSREWGVFNKLIFPAFLRAATKEDEQQRNAVLEKLNNDLQSSGTENNVLLNDLQNWLSKKKSRSMLPVLQTKPANQ
jgi:hypothetical protein